MERLIRRHGPCPIGTRKPHSLFHSLASAIISQQLSVKAAHTIQSRVMALTSNPMSPRKLDAVSDEELRSCGLSKPKIAYIRSLAEAVQGGLTKQKLQHLDDEAVIKELTKVKGIGRWSAEMFLMFNLHRLDVVSLGDGGLQRAARNLYNNGEPEDGLLEEVSEHWRPYRTVACWHLWQSLENTPKV